jgi:hypothetical protein
MSRFSAPNFYASVTTDLAGRLDSEASSLAFRAQYLLLYVPEARIQGTRIISKRMRNPRTVLLEN